MKKLYFFLVFLFTYISKGLCQESAMQFERITSKDGLPQVPVKTIFKDSKGFLWIGTADGLYR